MSIESTVNKDRSVISKIFASVSLRYDVMNDVMSLFNHRYWKRKFVNLLPYFNNFSYLDLSCGTGDITSLVFQKYHNKILKAYLIDPEPKMLDLAKDKILDSGQEISKISFIQTSAEEMVIKEEVDLITLSFGARNFSNLKLGLENCFSALKTNGWLYCMEFSPNLNNHTLDVIYKQYLRYFLPKMGKVIAKNEDAYTYLADSIKSFLSPAQMLDLFQKCGFKYTDCISLSYGAVNIYIGQKCKINS